MVDRYEELMVDVDIVGMCVGAHYDDNYPEGMRNLIQKNVRNDVSTSFTDS